MSENEPYSLNDKNEFVKRRRRSTLSTSSETDNKPKNHRPTTTRQKNNNLTLKIRQRLDHFKNSLFFNFILLFIISILANSIYYNFILNQNSLPLSYRVKKLTYDENPKNKPSLKSLIAWSAPSNYLEQSDDLKFEIKSYDHVFFGSIDDKYYASQTESNNNENLSNRKEQQTETSFDDSLLFQIDKNNQKEAAEKKRYESKMALSLAKSMQESGKLDKAGKIYRYALDLDPENVEALTLYGEYLELYKKDVIKAEHFYTKAINMEPENNQANLNLKRALPLVTQKDRQMLDKLDNLLKRFYEIPISNGALKRAKKEAYFMHIYHSNAIEGNTLNLQQTRHIVENRMAVNGKSIQEHNEVLGLDLAMRFLNETLLYRPLGHFKIKDILDIHKRVLGFCDPIESGKFHWLNSKELLTEAHPVQIAAMAHYKFVYIHPFYDGNGRTARLIMNLLLMKFGYPPIIINKEDRLEYYEYLEMANQGDIKPFIRFIAKCTHKTLLEYIRVCNNSYSLSVDENEKMYRGDLVINKDWYLDNDENEKEDF
ncbi:unnamed protein product [Brachionus calyciflorus]|uniref:protein adenylyltransferase n=1 Tax=Brachionus calyciflorus TaxID=104777 RepID=A0A814BBQ8_9BILA|nr:unnamed protein product [Brachionus calyciflorus]CAF0927031.1 unnamed protein product [Brachionus calyciflorus]